MRVLVVGDCLMVQAIERALRHPHNTTFACGKEGELEMWMRRFTPDLVLIDTAGLGMAGIDLFRRLRALGYKGKTSFTQSEGVNLPRWAQAPLEEGLVHGLLQVPWTKENVVAWFKTMTPGLALKGVE